MKTMDWECIYCAISTSNKKKSPRLGGPIDGAKYKSIHILLKQLSNRQSTPQTKALTSCLQHSLRNQSTSFTMKNNLKTQYIGLGLGI